MKCFIVIAVLLGITVLSGCNNIKKEKPDMYELVPQACKVNYTCPYSKIGFDGDTDLYLNYRNKY